MLDSDRLKELAFDFYERYILLEPIGSLFRPVEPEYRVLDVGGHTPVFWPGFSSMAKALIPDASVAVVDVVPESGLKDYIRASGLQLPFRDETFDLVCSLDTLEHVPAEDRPALLCELLRVTRDGLYVAFPFDSPSNRWAESVVVEYADVVLKNPIPALLEHRQFGLPDREQAAGFFSGSSSAWVNFDQGNTDVWLLMMLTYHSLRAPGTDFVQELNRRFNQVYAAQDWGAPTYRTGYVLSKRRRREELEALRASFVRTEKRADLQAVLALCQLFMSIAQNGRVTVDKDRHIRSIEHARDGLIRETGQLREHLDQAHRELERKTLENSELNRNISQIAAQLEELRKQIGDLQNTSDAQMRQSTAQLASEARLDERMRQLESGLEELRKQVGDLQNASDAQMRQSTAQLASEARLDEHMRQIEIGLVTNKRAIQAIYDSRIWKALCGLGGLALRWSGRTPERRLGSNQAGTPFGAPNRDTPWIRTPTAPSGEFPALVCDYPGTEVVLPVRDVIEIRGWALAASGIDRVLVQINNDAAVVASYGILRQDVGRSHPEIAGADHSGFRFIWDTTGLPQGPCTVRITAVARSGETREVICNVVVDRNSSPGYDFWIARNEPAAEEKRRMKVDIDKFTARPRISIAVPVYKTPIEILRRCIESVKSQIYPNWELCLADDGSGDPALTALLLQCSQTDPRIRAGTLPRNRGIAAATNEALSLATGEYVAFLDHDDELADFALWEVVRAINEHPDTDLFYSDEDKIDEQERRYDAFFKPGWSPDLFLSCNYICHFLVVRRSLVDRLGGLDESYNGSQDYDFLLRATEQTRKIERIPKVLYHWRAIPGSAANASDDKPRASEDGRRALASYLARTAPGATVEEIKTCRYRVRYPIAGNPRVTLLIPTNGHMNLFRAAVEDVLEKTSYRNYDIVLIDNSQTSRVEEYAARQAARKAPVRYLDWRSRPFNFSTMNNEAARRSESPYILFLNDDTTVMTGEWLTAMLEHAQRPEVGAVGAQLWYPNDMIQHAGVVMGLYGNCSHAFKNLPGGRAHYFDFPDLIRNCSAVTAACLLVAREKFFKAGGFDESNLTVAFQDVDLCLKLLELGYRNVYTPYAKLYHYESASKTENEKIPHPAEDSFMKKKWAKYIANDPYYNPNLARRSEDFSLAME